MINKQKNGRAEREPVPDDAKRWSNVVSGGWMDGGRDFSSLGFMIMADVVVFL